MSRISPRTMTRLRSGSTTEGPNVKPTTPRAPTKIPDDTLASAQKDLLRSPKYSDLTIICDKRQWQCQRSILTQRCHFFAAALTPGFRESEKNKIELPDDDPDAVDVMLLYLYTLQRPDFTDGVYKLADKYDIPGLRTAAKDYFLGLVESSLANWHQCSTQMKSLWIAWVPIFWDWSMEGSDEIREAIVDSIVKTSKSMIEDAGFQNVLCGKPDFVIALFKALAAKAKAK